MSYPGSPTRQFDRMDYEEAVEPNRRSAVEDEDNETREVLLTWDDGKTTETSRQVLNKFKAIYGENPKCKIEIR